MKATEIIVETERRCLAFRAMARLVNSSEFGEAWKLDPNNDIIIKAIRDGVVDYVRSWIDRVFMQALDISELNIHKLRSLASQYGIKGYTSYPKEVLLIEVLRARKASKTFSEMSSDK